MISNASPLGKYRLYPNWAVKAVFFLGIAFQVATLALAIAMLSYGTWMKVEIEGTTSVENK